VHHLHDKRTNPAQSGLNLPFHETRGAAPETQ